MNLRNSLRVLFSIFSRPAPEQDGATPSLSAAPTEIAQENEAKAQADPVDNAPDALPDLRDEQDRLLLTGDNFKGLIGMFGKGTRDLQNALGAARADRNAENVHQAAFELFKILKPFQIHFIAGGEPLWIDSARKMRELASEAAAAPGASADICNFAGVVCAMPWGFGDFSLSSGPEGMPVDLPAHPGVPSDMQQALKWFEKGAELGDETCAENAARATRELAAEQPQTPPSSSPLPPTPAP